MPRVADSQTIFGVILAGGRGRRLGGIDKADIVLGARPLVAHVIARLAPQVDTIAINSNSPGERWTRTGLAVLADIIEDFPGPLAGILAGLLWARSLHPGSHVVTVAVDTPFIPCDLSEHLLRRQARTRASIILAKSRDRIHPVIGLWPSTLADDLDHAVRTKGTRKVMEWVRRHPHDFACFGDIVTGKKQDETGNIAIDPFFNINTPDDLERAKAYERIITDQAPHGLETSIKT